MTGTVWLDPAFWSGHFERVFVPQIVALCDAVICRVLPSFGQVDSEAESVAEEEYNRLGSLLGDEDADMADAADRAQEAGLAYYEAMTAVEQTVLNVTVVALHHLFEQQLLSFHRRQVLHRAEEDDANLINLHEMRTRLKSGGVHIETLPSWPKVDELRVVANAVKHAEGDSAERLRMLRPDLLVHPVLRDEDSLGRHYPHSIYLPLGGEDIYITVNDIQDYKSAVTAFWHEFGSAIHGVSRH